MEYGPGLDPIPPDGAVGHPEGQPGFRFIEPGEESAFHDPGRPLVQRRQLAQVLIDGQKFIGLGLDLVVMVIQGNPHPIPASLEGQLAACHVYQDITHSLV